MSNTLDATLPALEASAEVYALTSTSQTLTGEVMRAVQDASYTYEDILELFNDCLFDIAGKHLIPDLETFADIYTDPNVNHVRVPADYHRNLRYCHSITHNRKRRVYGSKIQLMRWFSNLDQTGPVNGIAVQGRDLYYQRVPSTAEQLRINYYRYPDRLQSPQDKPACIPWHIAKKLLKHYALKELFSEIEDGIEGPQVNTDRHEKRYAAAEAELVDFIGPEEREPQEVSEEINWEAMM